VEDDASSWAGSPGSRIGRRDIILLRTSSLELQRSASGSLGRVVRVIGRGSTRRRVPAAPGPGGSSGPSEIVGWSADASTWCVPCVGGRARPCRRSGSDVRHDERGRVWQSTGVVENTVNLWTRVHRPCGRPESRVRNGFIPDRVRCLRWSDLRLSSCARGRPIGRFGAPPRHGPTRSAEQDRGSSHDRGRQFRQGFRVGAVVMRIAQRACGRRVEMGRALSALHLTSVPRGTGDLLPSRNPGATSAGRANLGSYASGSGRSGLRFAG